MSTNNNLVEKPFTSSVCIRDVEHPIDDVTDNHMAKLATVFAENGSFRISDRTDRTVSYVLAKTIPSLKQAGLVRHAQIETDGGIEYDYDIKLHVVEILYCIGELGHVNSVRRRDSIQEKFSVAELRRFENLRSQVESSDLASVAKSAKMDNARLQNAIAIATTYKELERGIELYRSQHRGALIEGDPVLLLDVYDDLEVKPVGDDSEEDEDDDLEEPSEEPVSQGAIVSDVSPSES